MDENYREIPGTNPKQYLTDYVAFTDRILPPIQDPIQKIRSPNRVLRRLGQGRLSSDPQSELSPAAGPDPVWNNANCRNRRLFNDRAVKKVAANTKPFLLQTYRRDMGGGNFVLMKDLSSPILRPRPPLGRVPHGLSAVLNASGLFARSSSPNARCRVLTVVGLATELKHAMKHLFEAGKLLLLDMASTFFFLVLYLLTHNIILSVVLGMALGVAQIGWQFARKKPIDTMQWMSLFLVLGSGTATLLTNDPRFVMIKPSVIYLIVGIVMLKPGWMNRYLPPVAIEMVPDIAFIFGFVWAGLMFFSAGLNLIVALNFSVVTWSAFMSIYGIVSKALLFLIGYATMRTIGVRRRRAQMVPAHS